MALSSFYAPKIGAALAFGLIATSIAISESKTWSSRDPVLPPASFDQIGPPMPTSMIPSASDPTAAEGIAPEQAAVPKNVRIIEMPHRKDVLNELALPTEPPQQYQVAGLPQPEVPSESSTPTAGIEETLIAPIPAPAYRRPVISYLVEADEVTQPQAPVSLDSLISPQQGEYAHGTWPRRLDQVVTIEGQAGVVDAISSDNLFLSDWVEVRRGGVPRVIAQ